MGNANKECRMGTRKGNEEQGIGTGNEKRE